MKKIVIGSLAISACVQVFSAGVEDADSLPAGFSGHSCSSIFKAAKALKGRKDKFESTDEYEKRIGGLADSILLPGVKLSDQLNFRVGGLSRIDFTYDADKQYGLAQKTIGPGSLLVNDRLTNIIIVDQRNISSKATKASNAYGVTKTITIDKYSACGIAPINIDTNGFSELILGLDNLSSDKARRAEGNLAFLVEGLLQPPFSASTTYFSGATISTPTEVQWAIDVLPLHVNKTIVYNTKTGEILGSREFK